MQGRSSGAECTAFYHSVDIGDLSLSPMFWLISDECPLSRSDMDSPVVHDVNLDPWFSNGVLDCIKNEEKSILFPTLTATHWLLHIYLTAQNAVKHVFQFIWIKKQKQLKINRKYINVSWAPSQTKHPSASFLSHKGTKAIKGLFVVCPPLLLSERRWCKGSLNTFCHFVSKLFYPLTGRKCCYLFWSDGQIYVC